MSPRINPYSLIRPFSLQETSPFTTVADLKTARIGQDMSDETNMHWERKQWGYQVPYATSLYYLRTLVREKAWYRPVPTENDYKNIAHFDGYLHNAKPIFAWFANVVAGERITVAFQFGAKQDDIVSESGVNNKGGVVSILEVLGSNPFYFGVTVRVSGTTDYNYFSEAIDPENQMFGFIETNLVANGNTTYEITPWISDKGAVGNNLPANAKYYSLKLSEDYESYKTFKPAPEYVSMGLFVTEYTSNGGISAIRITANNSYEMPFRIANITMHIVYFKDPDNPASEILYPSQKEETRTINESIYIDGKSSTEISISGTRASVTLDDIYTSARVYLSGTALRVGDISYSEETFSNMVFLMRTT